MPLIDHVTNIRLGAAHSCFEKDITDPSKLINILSLKNTRVQHGTTCGEFKAAQLKNGAEHLIHRARLLEGDVVLGLYAPKFSSVYITKELSKKSLVASPHVGIIRPNIKLLRGEVIVSFLNSSKGQSLLSSLVTGAAIGRISLSSIGNIDVPTPNTSTQNKIAELFHYRNNKYQEFLREAESMFLQKSSEIDNYM